MTPSFFERHNVKSLSDLLRIVAEKDNCWRTTGDDDMDVVWTLERSEEITAAAILSVKCSSSQQFFYVAVTKNESSSIVTAKQRIVRWIEELAYLHNNNSKDILQFHGNETSPVFVGTDDFSDEQLRTISCSYGPFEWVNCVFSPQQAVAAFVASPGKRNVRFVSGGITDGGEAMMDYLKTHTTPSALGKIALSSNVFRGNAHSFLQTISVDYSLMHHNASSFLWDELEWVQPNLPPALRQLLANANVCCLALHTQNLLHVLNAIHQEELRAQAIRWCVYPRDYDDQFESTIFHQLIGRVFNGQQWHEFYFDVDRSIPLFWSHDRIRSVLLFLMLQQENGSCLRLVSLNGLTPFDFDIDEWNRFLRQIEEHPYLHRVELQACSCDSIAAAEWVRLLREVIKRIRSRPRPLEIVFLEADDDPMAARFWQLQVVQEKYDDIRSIESSATRALTLVHALSLYTGVTSKDSETRRKRRAWNPDGVYFLLSSNQDLWISST